MSRTTGVVVALATTAAVLSGATVGAAPPADASAAAELPRQVRGGVELTLADGDLFRVWTSPGYRTVWGKRRDAATGTWGPRRVVLRKKNLFCGDVDARTAAGAVAVIAECDRFGYAEDQAPVASQALWSADTLTWSSYALEGEAYEEPGISPGGSRAVWPEYEGYVTWGPEGFSRHRLATPNQEYTATATITDDAQVSYLYGTASGRGRCAIVVLTRTGEATPTRQELPLANGCSDTSFVNVDSDTTLYGDISDPAFTTVISRTDAAAPWAITRVAPADAPGLRPIESRRMYTDFFAADGVPLLALGSRRGRIVRAQVYDPTSQTWGPSTVAYDAGARQCRWGETVTAQQLGVIVVDLDCGDGRHVVLTTRDGVSWQALGMGRNTYGLSPDGRYVVVPGVRRTYVISPELGVVTLPFGVTGRCDVAVPDGPDGAVLLTAAGRHRGWPTVLQHSSPDGWTRLSRTDLPTPSTQCRQARVSTYDLPYRFDLFGGRAFRTVRILQRDGVWTARRTRL